MKTLIALACFASLSAFADTSPQDFSGKAFHCEFAEETFFAFNTFDFTLGKRLSAPNFAEAIYATKVKVGSFEAVKTKAQVSSRATRVTTGEHVDVPVPGIGLTLAIDIVETSGLPGKVPVGITGLAVSDENSDHPMAPLALECSASN